MVRHMGNFVAQFAAEWAAYLETRSCYIRHLCSCGSGDSAFKLISQRM